MFTVHETVLCHEGDIGFCRILEQLFVVDTGEARAEHLDEDRDEAWKATMQQPYIINHAATIQQPYIKWGLDFFMLDSRRVLVENPKRHLWSRRPIAKHISNPGVACYIVFDTILIHDYNVCLAGLPTAPSSSPSWFWFPPPHPHHLSPPCRRTCDKPVQNKIFRIILFILQILGFEPRVCTRHPQITIVGAKKSKPREVRRTLSVRRGIELNGLGKYFIEGFVVPNFSKK